MTVGPSYSYSLEAHRKRNCFILIGNPVEAYAAKMKRVVLDNRLLTQHKC